MRKSLVAGLALMLCMFPVENVKAENTNTSINIDGEYSDWNGKAGVEDKEGDTTGGTDLKELKFERDGNRLYINVKRFPTKSTDITGDLVQWNLRIPIINADPKYGTIPVFLPWDEIKDENGNGTGVWPNDDNPTQEVAYLVTVSYRDDWDNSTSEMARFMNVTVSIGNNRQDYLYKCIEQDETEFYLDLDWVGLGDDTSEVEFAVGSNTDAETHSNIDWISEDGPIKITNGPILGDFTMVLGSALFLGTPMFIFRDSKRKKKKI